MAESINLANNTDYRNPTEEDFGKPMYYVNGTPVTADNGNSGKFNGFKTEYGEQRAKVLGNNVREDDYQITKVVNEVYVKINPLSGGKSRRRRTKKTRRGGKSKRRGRKTRGQRR